MRAAPFQHSTGMRARTYDGDAYAASRVRPVCLYTQRYCFEPVCWDVVGEVWVSAIRAVSCPCHATYLLGTAALRLSRARESQES